MSEPKYKWVPVEANHDIVNAMAGEDGENWDQWMPPKHYEALYRVGVAAAPSPPQDTFTHNGGHVTQIPQDPRDEAQRKAKEIMQHGRIVTLVTAMEEAAASIEAGMAQGALGTLRKTLHDDKTFYTSSPAKDHPRDEALRVAREALEDMERVFAESKHTYRANKCAEALHKIKALMGEK